MYGLCGPGHPSEMKSGEKISVFIADPLGEPETPLDWPDLVAKAKTLLPFISENEMNELQERVRTIEGEDISLLYQFIHSLSLK